MVPNRLQSVPAEAIRQHLLQALARYWPKNTHQLLALPITALSFPKITEPLRLIEVRLPEWGEGCGIDGSLMVPRECGPTSVAPRWDQVDWWLAAFLMLEGWHERIHEQRHGPIHSYSLRLKRWDERIWKRAWVNRIALFLRAWAATEAGQDESALFGPLPRPEIRLTHDIDALAKTVPIRIKQSAFMGFNAVRLLANGRPGAARSLAGRSLKFLLGREDWLKIGEVQALEREACLRSQFNFYADDRPKNLKRWLFDPGYDIGEQRFAGLLTRLSREGWQIGLHQSFDAWRSADMMRRQRERLQSFLPTAVTSCRQHWLRFSWQDTWAAQTDAGFEEDTTLMFNDRPGFRAAAALSWAPWHPEACQPHRLHVLPTVLMDSHLFDYQPIEPGQRMAAIHYWLDEIRAVAGQAAILWHPHTLTADYGWNAGFQELIEYMKGMAPCPDS